MRPLLMLACLLTLLAIAPDVAASAQSNNGGHSIDAIGQLIGNSDSVAVAAPGGEIVYAKNADKTLVPASILKIPTALTAFSHLGPDYRFPTEFYVDEADNLVIKGYGDPFLVSEAVSAIAGELAEKFSGRLDAINDLVMDGSYFDNVVIPGVAAASIRSYDAPVGALCVNFNTVFFENQGGTLVSAEPQTPLLPTAKKRIRMLDETGGRVMLSSDRREITQYAGELFAHFLEQNGVEINGEIRQASFSKDDTDGLTLLYRYESDIGLSAMVYRMMKYSNNFVANQILLAAGAKAYGAPATLEKGVRAAEEYARGLGIEPDIAEGSGISRENRVTAEMMIALLDAFAPHYELLQKRERVYFKTGTLDGIRTRAGYIEGKDGVLYRFVVMINTRDKLAEPVVDRIERAF